MSAILNRIRRSHELVQRARMLGLPKACSRPLRQGCNFGSENRALWTATRYSPLRKQPWPGYICCKRYKTTEAGDNKSGHIEAGQNEGIFFLDSSYRLGSVL